VSIALAVDAGSNTKDTLGQKAAKLDRETEELKRAQIRLALACALRGMQMLADCSAAA
jgi:hypothetical protein